MRIGIDYTSAARQRAGIGRYTRSLVRALAQQDSTNSYALFVAGAGALPGDCGQPLLPKNTSLYRVPLSDRWVNIIWQRLRMPAPIQLITGRLDLFHSPDFVLPPTGKSPAIVTVHDLSFLRVPECFVPRFTTYLHSAVSRAVARAAHILADSESTRMDLIALLGAAAERISVVYPGVEQCFKPVRDPEEMARVRGRYSLPVRFVLGLGTLQPRKNFVTLIEAIARLIHSGSSAHELQDLALVLVGQKGWMHEDIAAAARASGLEERVHLVGFVADDDLPSLYSSAAAFAFPSLYEGFGLPVLEAMACGTPVVAADNSSLPEVVGKAGLLVNARDRDGLAGALEQLIINEPLRQHVQALGFEQAKRFTWERAASQLLALYRKSEQVPHGGNLASHSQATTSRQKRDTLHREER